MTNTTTRSKLAQSVRRAKDNKTTDETAVEETQKDAPAAQKKAVVKTTAKTTATSKAKPSTSQTSKKETTETVTRMPSNRVWPD